MGQSPLNDDDPYSSDDTIYVDSGSEDGTAYETDLTDDSDVDDAEGTGSDGEKYDSARLLADNEHPPEYYLRQQEEFEESEYTRQDYSGGSMLLLDRIEEQWYQYADLCVVSD
jgi:hypothetical protein